MSNMKNIVVLVSGGGTNLQALIDAEKSEGLGGGKITCVIASKPDAYALTRAADNGIKTRVLARRDYADVAAYSKAMADALKEEQADLVIYAGFMTILDEQVCDAFRYKMINVHPALIPSFCGKGYYGLHVHEEALKKGVKTQDPSFCKRQLKSETATPPKFFRNVLWSRLSGRFFPVPHVFSARER